MNDRSSRSCLVHALAALMAVGSLAALPAAAATPDNVEVTRGPRAVGKWLHQRPSPVIAIHSVVLPTGKVLQFSYPRVAGAGGFPAANIGAEAALFDPKTKSFTELVTDEHDIFCAGHSFLPDGRVFITGGFDSSVCAEGGIPQTHFFDPFTETFEEGPRMHEARYYPTNRTIADGSVLVFSGYDRACRRIGSVEILRSSNLDRMQHVPKAAKYIRLYPAIFLLPDGRLVNVGPEQVTRVLEPGKGEWQNVAVTNHNQVRHHSAAFPMPGEPWKFMICGGYHDEFSGPTDTCETIDMSEAKPKWQYTAPMHYPRGHLNAVLLPDKTVFVVGGGWDHDYNDPVRVPELYDPEKDTWTLLPTHHQSRMYHSTAVLLPDGSVLSGGQDEHRLGFHLGQPEAGEFYEIYRPAYLYKGKQPRIVQAPDSIAYGEHFNVEVVGARRIRSAVLMGLSAVTHSTNMTQQLLDLSFEATDRKQLELEAPEQPNLAPPGYYMLFVLNKKGVPSEAAMVQLLAS